MKTGRLRILGLTGGLLALALAFVAFPALAEEARGIVKSIDTKSGQMVVNDAANQKEVAVEPAAIKSGTQVVVNTPATGPNVAVNHDAPAPKRSILAEFWYNFTHNLFKPLLLFFYMGFLVPILRVKLEFPYVVYQAMVIYLLLAIGWHGGEELAMLNASVLGHVLGFMLLGFATNFLIGILAYLVLKNFTRLRRVDQATVAGYYGSDSAGTFATCVGVLLATKIAYDAYMPVMLAVMEIPGCLVALYLVSKLRHQGMDALGNMPDEPGYDPRALPPTPLAADAHGHGGQADHGETAARRLALEDMEHPDNGNGSTKEGGIFSGKLLHEVFLNSGLYLLFGGIAIGFISGLQGAKVTAPDDKLFLDLFQGILCLFLLEMGMTASRKLMDLRQAGWRFVVFGIVAPNVFATLGILVAHAYSMVTHTHFDLGTYVLFSVLCGAASYIAVPAVQRLAIPEASPTLPLAASLGLTFSYNVTIGIPLYIEIAKAIQRAFPVG